MDSRKHLYARDGSTLFSDDGEPSGPPPMANLIVTLLAFLFIGSSCAAAFFLLRRRRQARRNALLPCYQPPHHRHLTITTSSDFVNSTPPAAWEEKRNLMTGPSSPPEIRITFPDEEGAKDKGGRVVVVRVSESGSVGMAPLAQDALPPYQSSDADRFQSLDLNRIGGLKEKEQGPQRWS